MRTRKTRAGAPSVDRTTVAKAKVEHPPRSGAIDTDGRLETPLQADLVAPGWRSGAAERVRTLSSEALIALFEKHASAQWFTGKGRTIASAQITAAAPIPGTSAVFAIAELRYADGGKERFQLPISIGPDGKIDDALDDGRYVRALIDLVRDGTAISAGRVALVAGASPGFEGSFPAAGEAATVTRLKGPQSNFSYRVGEGLIYKAYAHPERDPSIEREMTAHLTEQGYRATPQLLGAVGLEGKEPETVGLVFEFAANQGDGWGWVLESLAGKTDRKELLDRIELLGKRIGEMHQALAAPTVDPAFAPQPIGGTDLDVWSQTLRAELRATHDALRDKDPALAAELDQRELALIGHTYRVADLAPSGYKIRIHGDLHLGQTLIKDQDWLVLDFEGEPARSKEERRAKYTPLRDVAGMLRSFGYAEAQAEKNGTPAPGFAKEATARFLAGYRPAVESAGILPTDEKAVATILAAAELEKVMYEVRYELKSRPDWVGIPFRRLLEIATE